MGRMYTATFVNITVTAAQEFFEVLAPADAVVIIHDWTLMQTTELGDAAEEVLDLRVNRGIGSVTSGSGGGTATIYPISAGDPNPGGTVETNNTTIMAVGTGTLNTNMEAYGWNVRIPFQKIYTPETRPIISPGNRWALELQFAPVDSITIMGTLTFEEIGG